MKAKVTLIKKRVWNKPLKRCDQGRFIGEFTCHIPRKFFYRGVAYVPLWLMRLNGVEIPEDAHYLIEEV
jgi:hypothetical protein